MVDRISERIVELTLIKRKRPFTKEELAELGEMIASRLARLDQVEAELRDLRAKEQKRW